MKWIICEKQNLLKETINFIGHTYRLIDEDFDFSELTLNYEDMDSLDSNYKDVLDYQKSILIDLRELIGEDRQLRN